MNQLIRTSAITVIVAATLIAVAAVVTTNASRASATQYSEVPLVSTAQARTTNVIVSASDNTIRVEFDYALANGATSAVVDASLQNQQSFGVTEITGPGHYDQTLTDLPDGNYSVFIVISGNPPFLLGDSGPSSQPMVISLPSTTPPISNGDQFVRDMRKIYHKQNQQF